MIYSNEMILSVIKLDLNAFVLYLHAIRGEPFQGSNAQSNP